MTCPLCQAVESGKYERYGAFILIPKCDVCGIPILVVDSHISELPESYQWVFDSIVSNHFPDKKARGIGMKNPDCKDHWHEHLVEK